MIDRFYKNLGLFLKPSHALIIFGPRRVGKTTLLEGFLKNSNKKYKIDSGIIFEFNIC